MNLINSHRKGFRRFPWVFEKKKVSLTPLIVRETLGKSKAKDGIATKIKIIVGIIVQINSKCV